MIGKEGECQQAGKIVWPDAGPRVAQQIRKNELAGTSQTNRRRDWVQRGL